MNGRRGMVIGGALVALVGLISSPRPLFGSDQPRAKEIFEQTCVQCHRLEGKPDSRFKLKAPDLIWAGSVWIGPKPAIHANIPFEKLPMDYLYNVINHGGAAIGKLPNMPYWNLTFGQQGVAM